ncbi:hypothetical protein [Coleofasciculus sp. FACHB-SPT36]|nr:hypothetical protein [Coleofasciculus sp. FACHB-SPT36]
MRVVDVTAIAQFYFTSDGDYLQMKAYIRMLDYLRLLFSNIFAPIFSL